MKIKRWFKSLSLNLHIICTTLTTCDEELGAIFFQNTLSCLQDMYGYNALKQQR